MKKTNFYSDGLFFKGNLHCHSILSDGRLTPQQLKDAYKEKGYHFVLFSDHNINTNFCGMNEASFVALQGFEGNMLVPHITPHKQFHLIFLKTPDKYLKQPFTPYSHLQEVETPYYDGSDSLIEYVNTQKQQGYMAIFNHPYWSFNDESDIACLGDSILGIEIFNYGCEIYENTGHSELMYDLLLRKCNSYYCFASDDNHNVYPLHSGGSDSFGGFICVKAQSLTEEEIITAIYDGSFYASSGPEIHDFYVEDGYAFVGCSPASRVYISNQDRNYRMTYSDSGEITVHEAPIDAKDRYVRAEVIDNLGRKAYTNPIWL